MAASVTLVSDAILAVVFEDFCLVFVTFSAESGYRPVNIAVLHFVLVVAVFVETSLDDITLLHGDFHALCVAVCTVAACLIQKFRVNSDSWKLSLNIDLMVARIVLVAVECVRNHCDWVAEIFFKNLWFWHVARNFSEYILVVP